VSRLSIPLPLLVISPTPALRSYERGVNTFDTANLYSNGLSEVYLGKAIKANNLPRDEIVVMTKVCSLPALAFVWRSRANSVVQLYGAVAKTIGESLWRTPRTELDQIGYVNQHGLSRKVDRFRLLPSYRILVLTFYVAAYFRLGEKVTRTPTTRLHRRVAVPPFRSRHTY
jgi:hypothetical protein